jgi:hypothetical protein
MVLGFLLQSYKYVGVRLYVVGLGSLRFTALDFVLLVPFTLDYFTALLRVFLKWYSFIPICSSHLFLYEHPPFLDLSSPCESLR